MFICSIQLALNTKLIFTQTLHGGLVIYHICIYKPMNIFISQYHLFNQCYILDYNFKTNIIIAQNSLSLYEWQVILLMGSTHKTFKCVYEWHIRGIVCISSKYDMYMYVKYFSTCIFVPEEVYFMVYVYLSSCFNHTEWVLDIQSCIKYTCIMGLTLAFNQVLCYCNIVLNEFIW